MGRARAAHGVRAASASSRPAACSSGSAARSSRERRWWEPGATAPAATSLRRRRDARGAAARQRPPAAARRRPGRHLPLRRPRLEPDHRARPARRATTSCARSRSPSTTRATTSAPTRRRSRGRSARATTSSRSARARSRARFRDVVRARGDAADPHRAGAAVPARARDARARASPSSPPARAPTSCSGATTCSRRSAVRELHARDPERAAALLDELYPHLGGRRRRRGPAWRRFLLETGAGDDPLVSHLTRVAATGDGQGASTAPRSRARRSDGGDPLERLRAELPPAFARWSALERAAWLELTHAARALPARRAGRPRRDGARRRGPLPVPRPPRLRARRRACRAERKLDRAARQGRAARARRAAAAGGDRRARASSPTARPRSRRSSATGAPGWVDERSRQRGARRRRDLGPARGSRACVRRCRAGRASGVREGMALVGVLSTQLWHERFFGAGDWPYRLAETAEPRVRIDRRRRDTTRGGAA